MTTDRSIAAGVGTGIGRRSFHAVAAWAWIWRSFDAPLPDVGGTAWPSAPVTTGPAQRYDDRPGEKAAAAAREG